MTIKTFVDRETELQLLKTYLTQGIEAEKGTVVFVTGEADVDKTELMNQFKDRALSKYPDIRLSTGYRNEFTGGGDPYYQDRWRHDALLTNARILLAKEDYQEAL